MYNILLYLYDKLPCWRSVLLVFLRYCWHRQSACVSHDAVAAAHEETKRFYTANHLLYETVNETTGDTEQQLADFLQLTLQYSNELAGHTVLDIGCGDGIRMTLPMASLLGRSHIKGVDYIKPTVEYLPDNLSFVTGSLDQLPVQDKSVRLVTAHWSVLNDLIYRDDQLKALSEIVRVLQFGGLFYFDVALLEGANAYEKQARQYKSDHSDEQYGTIKRTFPGNKTKKFYIYPLTELFALLASFNLTVLNTNKWETRSGQPRITMLLQLK